MTAKRKPGSAKATVQSEQFAPPAVETPAPQKPADEIVRTQTAAAEPAPEGPKRAMARFKVNSDTIHVVAHGPANYAVVNGEVELPATAEWYRPLVEGGILTRIG